MSRQREALEWTVSTFSPIAQDCQERARRLIEEVLEYAQAEGIPEEIIGKIAARVYSRPAGEVRKEIGQIGLTLDASAENLGLDAQEETQRELDRVRSLPPEHWRERHEAKAALGIAALSPED